MNKICIVRDINSEEPFGLVVFGDNGTKAFAVSSEADQWAEFCNVKNLSISEVREGLGLHLQAEFARPITDTEIADVERLLNPTAFGEFKSLITPSRLDLVDSVAGFGRRFQVKEVSRDVLPVVASSIQLTSVTPAKRQAALNYKALSFRSESTFSTVGFEVKRARALWDPNLGPSGGWRCPPGSQYGGYITDRFGRGCGGGALRRVGRALVNAGRGIDKLGARRDAGRLARAAERAQRGDTVRERMGAAARRGVANVSNALERGAQRLVGEYQPRDYDPRTGRMRRRGVPSPEVGDARRAEINSRLVEIADELNDIVDMPPSPDVDRRRRQLEDENRRLRRERDGAAPVRVARGEPVERPRRVVAPAAGRQARQQGARPVRRPVAERQREGVLERAARRAVGDFEPREYKPGDRRRIAERQNRYAKVSDSQLRRALASNGGPGRRQGEGRDQEAQRRQDRLEILQEMLNRGMEIPEKNKREVAQYRLRPQRKRRREGLNAQGRAAVALERAAQRVEQAEQPRKRVAPSRRPRPETPVRPASQPERERIRTARSQQNARTPIRRPQPKRQRGGRINVDNLDSKQNRRLKNAALIEKAVLDANWRKRLGLNGVEPISPSAIREYIKQRENNKPGAYIGVLKANANDWDVLDELQRGVNAGPAGALLTPDQVDLLNQLGPKRRQQLIEKLNIGTPAPVRFPTNQRAGTPTEMPSAFRFREPSAEEVQIVKRSIEEITGSMPDSRSRRNVRNRFPKNGLPNRAFWRDADWVGREPGDKDKHERRFARYYDSNGQINARGRLINEQLQAEREGREPTPAAVAARSTTESRTSPRTPNIPDAFKPPRNFRASRPVPQGMSLSNVEALEARPEYDFAGKKRDDVLFTLGKRWADYVRQNAGRDDVALIRELENARRVVGQQAQFNARRLVAIKDGTDYAEQARLLAGYRRQLAHEAIIGEALRVYRAELANAAPQPIPSAPVPNIVPAAPEPPSVIDVGRAKNAIPALVQASPRNKQERLPVLGIDGSPDDPMPKIGQVQRANIQNVSQAKKWLDDGKPLEQVPREFWWDALRQHVNGNAANKQFKTVRKNGGIIGDTVIYIALDKNGKATGQGFVLKRDRHENPVNATEVAAFMALNALGINVDPAGFDGGQDNESSVPAAILPFAWNRAGDGTVVTPKEAGLRVGGEIPNFAAAQFKELPDRAVPQRLAGALANFILQVPDRHDQNHMGAMIDGKPMVIPIDVGWAGRHGTIRDQLDEYIVTVFTADRRLMQDAREAFSSMPAGSPERAKLLADVTGVYDGMLERGRGIVSKGKKDYVEKVLDGLSPNQRANANVKRIVERRAEALYDMIAENVKRLEDQRDEFLSKIVR